MFGKKQGTILALVIVAIAVALCFLAFLFYDRLAVYTGDEGFTMEYESALFDTASIIQVDIQIDEADWAEMLENAIEETYYTCNVVINGEVFYNVGIRPKGNTSLSAIASDPDTNRYSFKLEFDKYVDGQTCFGLDKLILNNNYADATNMKEALVYDMYQYLDVDASLYNYAAISVNGEYWGVYLALEAVEDSFLLRNYGTEDGALYKPESMDGGMPGNFDPSRMGDMDFSQMTPPETGDQAPVDGNQNGNAASEDGVDTPQAEPDFSGFPDGGTPGGFSMSGGGANLNYTDDDLDSYSTIWEGAVTSTGDSDHRRAVTALKAISEGENLETYLDVDNVLKYMAVHTFVVNEDSLSGNMAHNYYLYESRGQLNILPWDYNLAFGGMNGGDASSVVNDAIDTPFDGTNFFDALLENGEYLARYHEYLRQLVDGYVTGEVLETTYQRIRRQIDELVTDDPTAFYDYEAYEAGAEMLLDTIRLRAESVRGQLDGSIPSTDEGQRADDTALIDASFIDLSVMGTFMGGGGGGMGPGRDRMGDAASADAASTDSAFSSAEGSPNSTGGTSAGQAMPEENQEVSQPGNRTQMTPPSDSDLPAMANVGEGQGEANFPSRGGMQQMSGSQNTSSAEGLLLCAVCLVILAVAILFACCYRRRSRRR